MALEIKQLRKLGVEQADRITKRGNWLPSHEKWKKWVLCTALSSASQKMDFLARREKSVWGSLSSLTLGKNLITMSCILM